MVMAPNIPHHQFVDAVVDVALPLLKKTARTGRV